MHHFNLSECIHAWMRRQAGPANPQNSPELPLTSRSRSSCCARSWSNLVLAVSGQLQQQRRPAKQGAFTRNMHHASRLRLARPNTLICCTRIPESQPHRVTGEASLSTQHNGSLWSLALYIIKQQTLQASTSGQQRAAQWVL